MIFNERRPVDANRPPGTHPVTLQKRHDFANHLLAGPPRDDWFCALWGKDIATHGYSVLQQCAAAGAAQMRVRTLRCNTTARRSGNESFLQEVGLVDVTDGVGFLSDRRSKGLDSNRTW